MIWRLLHLAFGWDYVQWANSADQGVARVYLDGRGVCFYWRYRNIGVIDRITSPGQVIWLTCHSSKYLSAADRTGEGE